MAGVSGAKTTKNTCTGMEPVLMYSADKSGTKVYNFIKLLLRFAVVRTYTEIHKCPY